MTTFFCKNTVDRKVLAVGLSYASATLMGLEAVHGGRAVLLHLNPEQTFALSAILATVSMFLGSVILARLISGQKK